MRVVRRCEGGVWLLQSILSQIDDFTGPILSRLDPAYDFADRRFGDPDAETSAFQQFAEIE